MSEIDPKLSRLYREASTEGPPPALDAAILAAARARCARPERRARASWLAWMAPASAVATLVLGVSVALMVEHEQPEPGREAPIRPITARPQSAPSAAEAAKSNTAAGAAPAATTMKAAPVRAAPAPAPAPALPVQEVAPAAPPAPLLAAPAPPAVQAFPAARRERGAGPNMTAPSAAAEANRARDATAGSSTAGAAPAPAAAGKLAPAQAAALRSAPAWLEEIGRLKRDGREREAAEQLAQFRKVYPDYPLPASLRGPE